MNNEIPNASKKSKLMPASENSKEELPDETQQRRKELLAIINSWRGKQLYCDVKLQAGESDSELEAHKIVLAASSPVFKDLLTIPEGKDQELALIKLQNVDPLALKLLIDYIYTAKLRITERNVRILLHGADQLQLTKVHDACCDFLKTHLNVSNCLDIRSFAEANGLPDLQEHADNFVAENLLDFVERIEFLTSPLDEVIKFISSDHLMVCERDVFECVMTWVKMNTKERESHLPELLKHVRLPLLSSEYLTNTISKEPLVEKNKDCQKLIAEALEYHSLSHEQKKLITTQGTKRRNSRKALLVMGGFLTIPVCVAEFFDFKNEKWYDLMSRPSSDRHCAGLAVINELVYAVGGNTEYSTIDAVDVYDLSINEWSKRASLNNRRSYHGVAVIEDLIYAVGGWDGSAALNSAEVYDPKTDEWRLLPPMSSKRAALGVGVINGLLYAVGGFNESPSDRLSTVECYNPKENTWELVAEMSIPRSGAAAAVLNGILYTVGGRTNSCVTQSGEAYDPEKNQWSPITDMPSRRNGAGLVTFNEMLYVIGGNNGTTKCDSIDVYSPTDNSWVTLPTSVNISRPHAGYAIIDKPRAMMPQI